MKIKDLKKKTEKTINDALVEFLEETELEVDSVSIAEKSQIGYAMRDYRVTIKATLS